MLPKLSANHSQERLGINAVAAYAAENTQIWREIEKVDVGIDGHLEYVLEDGSVTGRLVGVQAKGGPSWFIYPTDDGWKYYPSEKHRTYWERYPLPVMLVLHDTNTKVSYWMDARQALRSPDTSKEAFLLVPKSQVLETTPPLQLFQHAGAQSEPFIETMDGLIDALLQRRSENADFPVSFLDLFAGGLTNICRSIYFGSDLADYASEANLTFAGGAEWRGFDHDFLFDFVRFLVAQHLADVNFSDCLIDWVDRQMLPHFVAPLTVRGRELVDALQAKEQDLVQQGKMPDGGGLLVAQEGFFGMQFESYFKRLPRIYAFRTAAGLPAKS